MMKGYGSHGPYSKRPGYDLIIQALGGMMSITGSSVRSQRSFSSDWIFLHQ